MTQLPLKIDPPKGISIGVFRTIVLAAHLVYQTYGTKPTAQSIATIVKSVKLKKLENVLETEEFTAAMLTAGIPWTEIDALTDKQMLAIIEVSNPFNHRDLDSALRAAGTNYKEWNEWRSNPVFDNYYRQMTKDNFEKAQPEIERALIKNAREGKLDSIKYMNEITGRYNPEANQVQNVQLLMQRLIEAVQEEVTPEALSRIAAKMQLQSQINVVTPTGTTAQIRELYR